MFLTIQQRVNVTFLLITIIAVNKIIFIHDLFISYLKKWLY